MPNRKRKLLRENAAMFLLGLETHLGGGAIMRNKRPAKISIGVEIDPSVAAMWQPEMQNRQDLTVINGDAVEFLKGYSFRGNEFVYCDPPYLMETRKSGQLYLFEYEPDQHVELLETIKKLPCSVMISGYQSDLYDSHLKGWSVRSFTAQTRGGSPATECLVQLFRAGQAPRL